MTASASPLPFLNVAVYWRAFQTACKVVFVENVAGPPAVYCETEEPAVKAQPPKSCPVRVGTTGESESSTPLTQPFVAAGAPVPPLASYDSAYLLRTRCRRFVVDRLFGT